MSFYFDKAKEIVVQIFWVSLIIIPFVLIYVFREKDPPPKNEMWCASLIYFNSQSHSFDTTYTSVTVFDTDSIVNFTDQIGKVWGSKEFLTNEHRKDYDGLDYEDITLKNGERFKVLTISTGRCNTRAVEDSLRSTLITSEDDN